LLKDRDRDLALAVAAGRTIEHFYKGGASWRTHSGVGDGGAGSADVLQPGKIFQGFAAGFVIVVFHRGILAGLF